MAARRLANKERWVETFDCEFEVLGATENLGLFKFIKVSLQLCELVAGILWDTPLALRGLN